MKKMVIACDIDGVLNNLMEHICEVFNRRTGGYLKISDFKHYDIDKCLQPDDAQYIKRMFLEEDIWNDLLPRKESQMYLKKLVEDGHDIYLVTATDPKNVYWKSRWLQKYFPFIAKEKMVVLHDKYRFDCDIMVDDCIESLLKGCTYHRIVYDMPWNKIGEKDSVYNVIRAIGWKDVYEFINNIANEEDSYV